MKISKGMADEVFVMGDLRLLIQISALIDTINATSGLQSLWYPTMELRGMTRSDRIDEQAIKGTTSRRRDEPLLICTLADEDWVIDVNHGLEKRHRSGYPRLKL
jgi:hypothetical protein